MSTPGIFRRVWYRWKALRLPWRKQFLVGHDLAGNTFWEFKDAINAGRLRRIVRYGHEAHYADVKISPQWHQWLRHTRPAAPTLQEQQFEVTRQARMRQLAADADERWRSQPSYLDAPARTSQPAPALARPGGAAELSEEQKKVEAAARPGVQSAVEGSAEPVEQAATGKPKKENPWEKLQPKGGPSETWQPGEWTGSITPRR